MKSKSADKIKMPSIDELLGVSGEESATDIEISRIHSFANHPFKVLDDDKMDDLVESIKQNGVLTPVLVRPDKNNSYEMISGHRRMHAAIKAGLETIPAIVRDIEDDEAIVIMVDANIQREELQIQISDMLHGLISSESLFWKKQVILSGCRIQEYQKIGGFTPSDSGLILYAVKNIIEELLEVKQQKIQYCLISESYNMFYLIFYTEYFHSTMQTQQIEYQIKKLCEEMVDVLENNLFLPIAHIETGFFDGRDLYSKYLEVEQCMENDRTNQHMIIQMKDAKLEEERIIYALWKDKKFDQVAEKLVLYFNKTNSIQERQNLMIRLSYYLYIAMNEEKGEKQLIFKEFYDSFPKIKREFSEMEIAVRTTETLKKLTEKMEKMEKKILHPVIYNIQKDIRDSRIAQIRNG